MLIKNQKTDTRDEAITQTAQKNSFMAIQLDQDSIHLFDTAYFEAQMPQIYRTVLGRFRQIAKHYISFNLIFFTFFVIEGLTLATLFSFFTPKTFALFLGTVFITVFSYFLLFFFFQSKKPEQITKLKQDFVFASQQALYRTAKSGQHHLTIADALMKLSAYLDNFETSFYTLPHILSPLNGPLTTLARYCCWKDLFLMKELLIETAIEEHLLQIRETPTDLEIHASLANTYVTLSKLYKKLILSLKKKNQEALQLPFQKATELAIQEFQILNDYSPNDPWVHEQLALGYKNLGKPLDEIAQVEILLKLRPQDKEVLFRLGTLYFEQGENAKGLRVYEELKQANFKKAADLLNFYRFKKEILGSIDLL